MFFAALGMLVVPFMFLWAVFRVITGSAFWRRAFKYFFVMFGVVFVGAILLSGCSAAPSVVQPTPQVIFVTPEPTVAPTLRPTPVPVSSGWNAYRNHVLVSGPAMSAALTDMSDAAGREDFAATGAAATNIAALATAEIAWLDANPPDSCYAKAHRLYRAAIVLEEGGAELIALGIAAFDPDTIKQGTDMMTSANTALGLVSDEIPMVSC